jgi:hypothetical protein
MAGAGMNVGTQHTKALTYSRWERLHFWVFRRWPQSVVNRRLTAMVLDEADIRAWSIREAMNS